MQTASPIKTEKVETFIKNVLPGILKGKTSLNALFVTYNGVGHLPNGPVETKKAGLKITVSSSRNNERSPYDLAFGIASITRTDLGMMREYLEVEENKGERSQKKASGGVEKALLDGEDSLIIAYLGMTAMPTCLSFLEQCHAKSPSTFIVVLTCDCDKDKKRRLLGELVEKGVVNSIIFTEHCGGNYQMEEILDALKEQWPVT